MLGRRSNLSAAVKTWPRELHLDYSSRIFQMFNIFKQTQSRSVLKRADFAIGIHKLLNCLRDHAEEIHFNTAENNGCNVCSSRYLIVLHAVILESRSADANSKGTQIFRYNQ